MQTTIPFYDVHGREVVPGPQDTVRPRRGVFVIARAGGYFPVITPRLSKDVVELPGGGLDANETLDQAIEREWAEEVSRPFAPLSDVLAEHRQVRGFYAYDDKHFLIYDQTFRVYDFLPPENPHEIWMNSEGNPVRYLSWNDWEKAPLIHAHRLAIEALKTRGVL